MSSERVGGRDTRVAFLEQHGVELAKIQLAICAVRMAPKHAMRCSSPSRQFTEACRRCSLRIVRTVNAHGEWGPHRARIKKARYGGNAWRSTCDPSECIDVTHDSS